MYDTKQITKVLFYPLFVLLFVSCDNPDTAHIGTFNIEWLGDGIDDKIERGEADNKKIAEIIEFSEADVLALQEIENHDAMEKLMAYLPDYDFLISSYSGYHNQAFVFRKDLKLSNFRAYYPLQINNDTRPGIYAKIEYGNKKINILSVHLKSTSRYDSTEILRNLSYEYRRGQAAVLNKWIDSLSDLNEYFIITGDFNDNPKRKNTSIKIIDDNPDTIFLTDGFRSCKNKIWDSIDHIVISKNLYDNYLEGSNRIFNIYSSETDEALEKISDHCPVLATFNFHL